MKNFMEFNHELIIPNEDLPFKLFLFEGKDGKYKRSKHWHRAVEIFLVLEGSLVFQINNTSLPLQAADFVIVNPNEIHSIDAPEPNTTIVLQIPSNCLDRYVREGDYAVFSKQSDEDNLKLAQLIVQLFRTYQKKDFAFELKAHSLCSELLYLLVTEFMNTESDQSAIRQKRHLDKLSNITSYMKANYNTEITLESVARQFGFSPTYLSRMFKRYADVSYKTYLLDLRTEYGLREMMNTDHSLTEVAQNNGFPNSRAFAKAFQKRFSCLPSEYRKHAGEEAVKKRSESKTMKKEE